ncbi:MAG: hypothetical protein O2894_08845 [Planctomycetota bacterium]|nr:hypothetical protein [Planctomycetota bacterium]
MSLAALLLVCLAGPSVAEPPTLKVGATARRFELKVAGGRALYRFTVVAGARYRLTVQPGTLARPILELGRADEEPIDRVDPGAEGGLVVHVWDAERDAVLEARVTAFSAQTGDARIRLESLNASDEPAPAHRRYLGPTSERARVGELLVGDSNHWELAVEPGRAYVITPTQGSAGRVRLIVHGYDGTPLADSADGASAWLALPPLRFRAPERPADAPADAVLALVVTSLLDGGGTYGLHLRALADGEDIVGAEVLPPEPVERGFVDGEPLTFRAGPGDVAVLYVAHVPERTRVVEMKRGEAWVQLEDMGLGGTARSQENSLMVWFRPYYPGTYRFRDPYGPPGGDGSVMLHDRAALGSAPMHLGTGVDPSPRARVAGNWGLVGLGACMPGWDYLFVCVHAPDSGVAMRVVDADGKAVKVRGASDRTISPGLGPSLRFRVTTPGVYRLEAKSSRARIVRPLLRRAAD